MASKLMHAVQYDSYGGGPSGLKVMITHFSFLYVFSFFELN